MLSLGPQIRELWKSVKKASGWKHPRAPTVRLHFQDARAIPAVLTFLQAEAGRVVTLAPPEKEREELEEIVLRPQGGEGPRTGKERRTRAGSENAPFFCLLYIPPLLFSLSHLFWRNWEEGYREAPL